jgi:hypothetical protein
MMYWSSERLRYEASLRPHRASRPPACNRGAALNRHRESCRKLSHRTLSLPALVATHRATAYNTSSTRVLDYDPSVHPARRPQCSHEATSPARPYNHPRSSPQIPSGGRDFARRQQERGWDQTLRAKNTGGRPFKLRNKKQPSAQYSPDDPSRN